MPPLNQLFDRLLRDTTPQERGLLNAGATLGQLDLFKNLQNQGVDSAYGVNLQQFANLNNGVVGQHDFILKSAKASNGGVVGFASEILFGQDVPDFPDSIAELAFGKPGQAKSVSEGILGGSIGSELGKGLQSLAVPIIVLGGILILSNRKW